MQKQFPHKQRVKYWKSREQICFPNCKTDYEFLIRVSRQVYPTHLPFSGAADANYFPLEDKNPSWSYLKQVFLRERENFEIHISAKNVFYFWDVFYSPKFARQNIADIFLNS